MTQSIHATLHVIDFERASLTWQTPQGSVGRWRIIAAATSMEAEPEQYVLSSSVVAGDVYGKGRLPLDPAYSFQIIAGEDRHVILRDYEDARRDTSDLNATVFSRLEIHAPVVARRIVRPEDLAFSGFPWPLIGVVKVPRRDGRVWLLQFPIVHANHRGPKVNWEFQIETGPLLVPSDLVASSGAAVAGGFTLAYAYFSRNDCVDLAVMQNRGVDTGSRRYSGFARLESVAALILA